MVVMKHEQKQKQKEILKQVTRKSVRLNSESNDSNDNSSQSRITEFLNVRKRGRPLSIIETSKISEITSENFNGASPIGTPVKIKKRTEKTLNGSCENITVTAKKTGILTPSPSLESVSESVCIKNENFTSEKVTPSSFDNKLISASTPVPAYKRFAHLIEEKGIRNQKPKLADKIEIEGIKNEIAEQEPLQGSSQEPSQEEKHFYVPWLPLNEKWSFYEKLIFNIDSLCVLSNGRSQPCIFHKIQKTLENVLGKQVPIEKMEILKTIWPEAYEYRETSVIIQGKRIDSVAFTVPGLANSESSAALLNYRKEEVKGRIQKHLLNAHEKFLREEFKNLNDESKIIDLQPKMQLPKQWHPKFNQDTVKEITRTSLLGNCKDLLNDINVPKLIEKNILIAAEQSKSLPLTVLESVQNDDEIKKQNFIPKQEQEKHKLTLLERIRAKEQKLNLDKVFGVDAEIAKERAILEQMERFTQSVLFSFSSMKKTSLFLTDLTNKLIQSSRIPLSSAEVYERLKLLEKAAPEWIKIVDGNEEVDIGVDSVSLPLPLSKSASSIALSNAPKHVKILDKNRTLMDILECIKKMKMRKRM